MLPRKRINACLNPLYLAVVVVLPGCGGGTDPDPNQAPMARGKIPDQQMTEGDTVTIDLKSYFTDPDGDSLAYGAVTSGATVLSASVAESRLTLIATGPGMAKVTVTATDNGGLKATQEFDATVAHRNRAPTLTDSIPEQVVDKGDTVTIDLASHFDDPDGDSIAYEAATSNELLLVVAVSGDRLRLAGIRPGAVTVTVTATDPDGLTATQEFNTTVEGVNHAPEVADEIGDSSLDQDEFVLFVLSSHFSDPDDDPLTYTAVASDTLSVSVSIDGDTLKLGAGTPDGTTVEVTATDPSGLSATQNATVEVDEGFSEEFGDLDTLRYWRLGSGIKAELSADGLRLAVTGTTCGGIHKKIRSRLAEWWTINALIGREDSLAVTYVTVGTNDATNPGYRLLLGSGMLADGQSVNYRLDVYDGSLDAWIPRESGFSDGLDDSGYDLNDVTLEYTESSDTLRATADTTELFALDLGDENLPTIVTGEAGFGVCSLAQGGGDGETIIVESGYLEGGHVEARLEYRQGGSATEAGSAPPSIRTDRVVEWPGVRVGPHGPTEGRRDGLEHSSPDRPWR